MPALDRIGAPSELYLVEDRPDLSSARLVLFLRPDLTTEGSGSGLKSEGVCWYSSMPPVSVR